MYEKLRIRIGDGLYKVYDVDNRGAVLVVYAGQFKWFAAGTYQEVCEVEEQEQEAPAIEEKAESEEKEVKQRTGVSQALKQARDSEPLQEEYVPYSGKGEAFAGDVFRAAPNLIGQIAASMVSPVLGAGYMANYIGGSKYAELKDDGVDKDTALRAALANVVTQVPLESLSIKGMSPNWLFPKGTSGVVNRAKGALAGTLSESLTEAAQQYPEDIITQHAKDPTFFTKREGESQQDYLARMGHFLGDTTANAAYAGAVGGVLGSVGGAFNVGEHVKWSGYEPNPNTRTQRAIHTQANANAGGVGAEMGSGQGSTGVPTQPLRMINTDARTKVMQDMVTRNGMPYQLGSDGKDATDCGLHTLTAYRAAGIDLGRRTADAQYRTLEEQGSVFTDEKELQPGDLVFWHVPDNDGRWKPSDDPNSINSDNAAYKGITHVGIYMGDGKVHQAGSQGVGTIDLHTYDVVGFGNPYGDLQAGVGNHNQTGATAADSVQDSRVTYQQQMAELAEMLNKDLAVQYAIDLKNTTGDAEVIAKINEAEQINDKEELERLARENGFQDKTKEELTGAQDIQLVARQNQIAHRGYTPEKSQQNINEAFQHTISNLQQKMQAGTYDDRLRKFMQNPSPIHVDGQTLNNLNIQANLPQKPKFSTYLGGNQLVGVMEELQKKQAALTQRMAQAHFDQMGYTDGVVAPTLEQPALGETRALDPAQEIGAQPTRQETVPLQAEDFVAPEIMANMAPEQVQAIQAGLAEQAQQEQLARQAQTVAPTPFTPPNTQADIDPNALHQALVSQIAALQQQKETDVPMNQQVSPQVTPEAVQQVAPPIPQMAPQATPQVTPQAMVEQIAQQMVAPKHATPKQETQAIARGVGESVSNMESDITVSVLPNGTVNASGKIRYNNANYAAHVKITKPGKAAKANIRVTKRNVNVAPSYDVALSHILGGEDFTADAFMQGLSAVYEQSDLDKRLFSNGTVGGDITDLPQRQAEGLIQEVAHRAAIAYEEKYGKSLAQEAQVRDNGSVEKGGVKNDTRRESEEITRDRREIQNILGGEGSNADARRNAPSIRGIREEQTAADGMGEVLHRQDGQGRGNEHEDSEGAGKSSETQKVFGRKQHKVNTIENREGITDMGAKHVRFIESLTHDVEVGEPRTERLKAEGRDHTWKGVTEEERQEARTQMIEHGAQLEQWAEENGISLDFVTPEREAFQEKLIGQYYGGKSKYRQERQAFLILGLPAAGKSTVADPLAEQEGALIVDSDEFKKRLPEFENGAGANYLHEESAEMAQDLFSTAMNDGVNIVYPLVGKTEKSLVEKIKDLKENNYDVHLVYIDLPSGDSNNLAKEAVKRAINRYVTEGRLVRINYIEGIGSAPLDNYNKLKNTADITSYALYNNNVGEGQHPLLEDGVPIVHFESEENAHDTRGTGRGRTERGSDVTGQPSERVSTRGDEENLERRVSEIPHGTRGDRNARPSSTRDSVQLGTEDRGNAKEVSESRVQGTMVRDVGSDRATNGRGTGVSAGRRGLDTGTGSTESVRQSRRGVAGTNLEEEGLSQESEAVYDRLYEILSNSPSDEVRKTAEFAAKLWQYRAQAWANVMNQMGDGKTYSPKDYLDLHPVMRANSYNDLPAEIRHTKTGRFWQINQGVDPKQEVKITDITDLVGKEKKYTRKELQGLLNRWAPRIYIMENGEKVHFEERSARHIGYSPAFLGKTQLKVKSTLPDTIGDIVLFSTKVETGDNVKKNKKPSALRYHRYYAAVRVGEYIYPVRVVVEENLSRDKENKVIKKFELYDIIPENKKKEAASYMGLGKMPHHMYGAQPLSYDSSISEQNEDVNVAEENKKKEAATYMALGEMPSHVRSAQPLSYDSSIAKENGDVNVTEIESYQEGSSTITLEDLLKHVKSMDGTPYFQFVDRGSGGYDGKSMSNRARRAYEGGRMPLSKWSKKEFIREIEDFYANLDEDDRGHILLTEDEAKRLPLWLLRKDFLTDNGGEWHHTGAFYNVTNFYGIDERAFEMPNEYYQEQIREHKQKLSETADERRVERLRIEKERKERRERKELIKRIFPYSKYKTIGGLGRALERGTINVEALIQKADEAEREIIRKREEARRKEEERQEQERNAVHDKETLLALMVSPETTGRYFHMASEKLRGDRDVLLRVAKYRPGALLQKRWDVPNDFAFHEEVARINPKALDYLWDHPFNKEEYIHRMRAIVPNFDEMIENSKSRLKEFQWTLSLIKDKEKREKEESEYRQEHGLQVRGMTTMQDINDSARRVMYVFDDHANVSTFIHESGHIFLEDLREMARMDNAPEWVKNDWAVISDWIGWDDTTRNQREAHEKFAKGFEQYLKTGKAPTRGLKAVFQRFKEWLRELYSGAKTLPKLPKDVRAALDRMLQPDAGYEVNDQNRFKGNQPKEVKEGAPKEETKKVEPKKEEAPKKEKSKEEKRDMPKETTPQSPGRGRFYSSISERQTLDREFQDLGTRFEYNIAAIDVFNQLTEDGTIEDMNTVRPTKAQLQALSKYSGWGGMYTYLNGKNVKNGDRLRERVSGADYVSYINSSDTAYFTPPEVTDFMWKAIEKMGLPSDARILEPSMGIGNFILTMPKTYRDASHVTGIELDKMTGKMAQLLYPNGKDTQIKVMGYEQDRSGSNRYDLVITNVPFSKNVVESGEQRFDKFKPLLHDFFFLKGVDQLRPGGIGAFITTAGTMDKVDSKVRREIAAQAELVAAYRLPVGTFSGTQVSTDVIFLQKRAERKMDVSDESWIHSDVITQKKKASIGLERYEFKSNLPSSLAGTSTTTTFMLNRYFAENPDHVIGTITPVSDWRGNGKVVGKYEEQDQILEKVAQELNKHLKKIPSGIVTERGENVNNAEVVAADRLRKVGEVYLQDGVFYRKAGDESVALDEEQLEIKTPKDRAKVEALLGMKDLYSQLIQADLAGDIATGDTLRPQLKKAFTDFRSAYGKDITKSKQYQALIREGDANISVLRSLEVGGKNLKPNPIMDGRIIHEAKLPEKVTLTEAILMTKSIAGDIDINEIAKVTRESVEKVKEGLAKDNLAFQTPNGNWQTKEKYLNGNLAPKLEEAKAALQGGNKDMERNIRAIEEVLPEKLSMMEVEVTLGASWIAPEVYVDFLTSVLYPNADGYKEAKIQDENLIQATPTGTGTVIQVHHKLLPYGHTHDRWVLQAEGRQKTSINDFIRALMTGNDMTIQGVRTDEQGRKYYVTDEKLTEEANTLLAELEASWQEYLRSSKHTPELEREYNYQFNSFHTPEFDGKHLKFPGMMKEKEGKVFQLRSHQRKAVYKGLLQGRGVYAHAVGTGKTYTMGALAMESKRLGLANKTLILAKNSNYESVAQDIREQYPAAKIMVITDKGANATGQMAEAALGNYDIIIAPHSQTNQFLLSQEEFDKHMKKMREETRMQLESALEGKVLPDEIWDMIDGKLAPTDKAVEQAMKSLKAPDMQWAKSVVQSLQKRFKLLAGYEKDIQKGSFLSFEQMGIDQIMVDEAHAYKKPGVITRIQNVEGIAKDTTAQALVLNMLTNHLQETRGRGVHIFTGTPITNTATELYHMMKYVMLPEMKAARIDSFDDWFSTFAFAEQTLTEKTTGEYEYETRFKGFKNLPELRRMTDMFFDFVKAEDMPEFTKREIDGYRMGDPDVPKEIADKLREGRTENAEDVPYHKIVNVSIDLSPQIKDKVGEIISAAQRYKQASGKVKNEMRATGFVGVPTAAMRAYNNLSLDPRLEGVDDYEGSKVRTCANNVWEEYQKGDQVAQAIFMESGISDTRQVVARGTDGYTIYDSTGKPEKVTKPAFNVAKAIRDELIGKGIPKEEIVILSSEPDVLRELKNKYKKERGLKKQPNDGELKSLIAEDVSNCRIRVIIGTRSMLGTGVNMQHNLKAIHQLDAPWMPGELTQSIGRAVRQRNQWNQVKEYRYLTELDSLRWTRLAIKQSFISAIEDRNMNARSLEMSEMTDGDSGGNSALKEITASQAAAKMDNRPQEKMYWDNKAKRLEALKRGFLRTQAKQERRAQDAQREISALEKQLQVLDTLQKQLTHDKLKVIGVSKEVSEQKAIDEIVERSIRRHGTQEELGAYKGIQLYVQKRGGLHILAQVGDDTITLSKDVAKVTPAVLRSAVDRRIPAMVAETQGAISNHKALVEQAKKQRNAKFAKEEELAHAKERVKAIEKDMVDNPNPPPRWLVQTVPAGSTIYHQGNAVVVVGYRVDKTQSGEPTYHLVDRDGNEYDIAEIQDKAGMNPYEDYLSEDTRYEIAEESEVAEEGTENEVDEETEESAANEIDKKLQAEQTRWANEVDEFMKNGKSTKKYYHVMDSPTVFDIVGLPRVPIKISGKVMHKVLKGKHKEQHLLDVMKELPTLIADPVGITRNLDSKGEVLPPEKEALVILDKEADGKIVNAAFGMRFIKDGFYLLPIHTVSEEDRKKFPHDEKGNIIKLQEKKANVVKTVFARNSDSRFIHSILDDRILYWNRKKGEKYLDRFGQGMPSVHRILLSKENIQQSQEDVNSLTEENVLRIDPSVPSEKDLRELRKSYADRGQIRYNQNQGAISTYPYKLEDIELAFRGQKVTKTSNGYQVRLQGGHHVHISFVGEILTPTGQKARGRYHAGHITLSDLATEYTLPHEKAHFAYEHLLTDKQKDVVHKAMRALLKMDGNMTPSALDIEERFAKEYAQYEVDQRHLKNTGMSKILSIVKDFFDKVRRLFYTKHTDVFQDMASGKVFDQTWRDSKGEPLKFSTLEDVVESSRRVVQDTLDETEGRFSSFVDRISKLWSGKQSVPKNVQVKQSANAFNWVRAITATPDHLGASNVKIGIFTNLAKRSMRDLQRMRNEVDEGMEYIENQLDNRSSVSKVFKKDTEESKANRKAFDELIMRGEAEGKEYSRQELQAQGYQEGVINAYLKARELYDWTYEKTNDTMRGIEYHDRKMSQGQILELKDNPFVEILKEEYIGGRYYQVEYRVPKVHTITKTMTGAKIKEMIESPYVQIKEVMEDGYVRMTKDLEGQKNLQDDVEYSVTYDYVKEPLHKVKGYFHHHFENWIVYQELEDGTLEPVRSYKSVKDAVKYLAESELDPEAQYIVQPKMFTVPEEGGVSVTYAKYLRVLEATERKFKISREEAIEMMRDLVHTSNPHRFLGAKLARKGYQGYSQNMLATLRLHTAQVTRYAAMENFKSKAYQQFERVFGTTVDTENNRTSGAERYVRKYIRDVNGNPTMVEDFFNQQLGMLPFINSNSRPAMRYANAEMTVAAVTKLGLGNIGSAMINFTQLMNAVTYLGVKPFIKSHWRSGKFTAEEKKYLKDVGVETQVGLDSGAGYDTNRYANAFVQASLLPFTFSEQKVRQITALMAFDVAKERNYSYEKAVQFGQDVNDKCNFDYGINNAPLFIRAGGPVTQMLFQFMKFPMNQIDFVWNIVKNGTNEQRARLMIPLVASGVNGVPFWGAVIAPMLAMLAHAASDDDDYEDAELYLKRKCYQWADGDAFWIGFLNVAFHGLPALAGMDIGRRMGVGDFGADVSKGLRGKKYGYDLSEFGAQALGGVMAQSVIQSSKQLSYGNYVEAMKAIAVAPGNIAQAWLGETRTSGGRLGNQYSSSERLLKALGIRPLDEALESEKVSMIYEENAGRKAAENALISDYLRAEEDGDFDRQLELKTKLKERKISAARINNERKRRNQTRYERAFISGSKKQQKERAELYNW